MYRKSCIEHSRLVELLNYDPETGHFTWKVARSSYGGKAKVGAVAGSPSVNGYVDIRVDGTLLKAHRLAWFYVHREWPPNDIDHINRDRTDNRLCNLRLATRSQNNMNRRQLDANRSGYRGVSFCKNTNKWVVRIRRDGRYDYLGLYATPEEASKVYDAAAREIHGGYYRAANAKGT